MDLGTPLRVNRVDFPMSAMGPLTFQQRACWLALIPDKSRGSERSNRRTAADARPRMRRLKDFDKHSLVHIRVSLRRRDRDASQQPLDGAQIATLSQEMGRPAATALADAYWDRSRPVRVPYEARSANSGLRERSPPWKRKSSRPANA